MTLTYVSRSGAEIRMVLLSKRASRPDIYMWDEPVLCSLVRRFVRWVHVSTKFVFTPTCIWPHGIGPKSEIMVGCWQSYLWYIVCWSCWTQWCTYIDPWYLVCTYWLHITIETFDFRTRVYKMFSFGVHVFTLFGDLTVQLLHMFIYYLYMDGTLSHWRCCTLALEHSMLSLFSKAPLKYICTSGLTHRFSFAQYIISRYCAVCKLVITSLSLGLELGLARLKHYRSVSFFS